MKGAFMEYRIQKRTLDENGNTCWDSIPEAMISNVCWEYDQPDVKAKAQLCYTEEALYVKLSAMEKDIRAEHKGIYGMPCEDSCLEFFFAPGGDGRYFNIELNPNCAMYFGIGTGPKDLYRLHVEGHDDNLLCPQAERTEDGWYVTYAVPFSLVQFFFPEFCAKEGTVMKGNFYKCGDLTVKEHYLSWNEMTVDHPCFHYPPDFGTLVFD